MASQSTHDTLIAQLRTKKQELAERQELKRYDSPELTQWREEVKSILRMLFGEDGAQTLEFERNTRVHVRQSIFEQEAATPARRQGAWQQRLPHVAALLEAAIYELELSQSLANNKEPQQSLGFRLPHEDKE